MHTVVVVQRIMVSDSWVMSAISTTGFLFKHTVFCIAVFCIATVWTRRSRNQNAAPMIKQIQRQHVCLMSMFKLFINSTLNILLFILWIYCRYVGLADTLDEAAFLDPRVKSTPYLSSTEQARLHDRIYRLLIATSNKDDSADSDVELEITPPQSENPVPVYDTDRIRGNQSQSSLLGSLLGDMYTQPASSSSCEQEQEAMSELRRYRAQTSCPMDCSPLAW